MEKYSLKAKTIDDAVNGKFEIRQVEEVGDDKTWNISVFGDRSGERSHGDSVVIRLYANSIGEAVEKASALVSGISMSLGS